MNHPILLTYGGSIDLTFGLRNKGTLVCNRLMTGLSLSFIFTCKGSVKITTDLMKIMLIDFQANLAQFSTACLIIVLIFFP